MTFCRCASFVSSVGYFGFGFRITPTKLRIKIGKLLENLSHSKVQDFRLFSHLQSLVTQLTFSIVGSCLASLCNGSFMDASLGYKKICAHVRINYW